MRNLRRRGIALSACALASGVLMTVAMPPSDARGRDEGDPAAAEDRDRDDDPGRKDDQRNAEASGDSEREDGGSEDASAEHDESGSDAPEGQPDDSQGQSDGSQGQHADDGQPDEGDHADETGQPDDSNEDEQAHQGQQPAQDEQAEQAEQDGGAKDGEPPHGQAGSVKVREVGAEPSPPRHEPHIDGCNFDVLLHGWDGPDEVTVDIVAHPPTAEPGEEHLRTVSVPLDGEEPPPGHALSGRTTVEGLSSELADFERHDQHGWHLKLHAETSSGGAKQKTFWLDCPSGDDVEDETADGGAADGDGDGADGDGAESDAEGEAAESDATDGDGDESDAEDEAAAEGDTAGGEPGPEHDESIAEVESGAAASDTASEPDDHSSVEKVLAETVAGDDERVSGDASGREGVVAQAAGAQEQPRELAATGLPMLTQAALALFAIGSGAGLLGLTRRASPGAPPGSGRDRARG